jgi:hypothetical protein
MISTLYKSPQVKSFPARSAFTRRFLVTDSNIVRLCHYRLGHDPHYTQLEVRNYFTNGGLPPISSSWRRVPCGSRPEICFQLHTCCRSPYITIPLRDNESISQEYTWPFVKCTYRTCYWKFFHLRYTQVLCQYRLCKVGHAYLTYLTLQRQLSHLNGRKLEHRQV